MRRHSSSSVSGCFDGRVRLLILVAVVNQTLLMCGAVPAGVTTAVLSLWMSSDNKYGFLELCSADVATVAMGLNGINYGGCGKNISSHDAFYVLVY